MGDKRRENFMEVIVKQTVNPQRVLQEDKDLEIFLATSETTKAISGLSKSKTMDMRNGRWNGAQSYSLRDEGRGRLDEEGRVHSQVRRKEVVKWIKTQESATVNK